MTQNQQDILSRAKAEAANSKHGIAWVLDQADSRELIATGHLQHVEDSKYGDLLMVRPKQ